MKRFNTVGTNSVSLLEDCRHRSRVGFVPLLLAWGTSEPEAKVLITGPPVVPYTTGIGAGLYST